MPSLTPRQQQIPQSGRSEARGLPPLRAAIGQRCGLGSADAGVYLKGGATGPVMR